MEIKKNQERFHKRFEESNWTGPLFCTELEASLICSHHGTRGTYQGSLFCCSICLIQLIRSFLRCLSHETNGEIRSTYLSTRREVSRSLMALLYRCCVTALFRCFSGCGGKDSGTGICWAKFRVGVELKILMKRFCSLQEIIQSLSSHLASLS